ncbi:MAG: GDP-mannose 4,6-dehydratase [candidate division Zixibacteria bacterium]|nr:GDP-mannose 4,6-dehydratase [candidate division Zixibacteria bacterium]
MKILITGAAGFIGSHLTDRFIADGHSVVAVDNLSMGKYENISQHEDNERFEFHKLDILEYGEFRKVSDNCEIIVHLAAFKIPRYGNAIDTLVINNQGTVNVLKLARELNAKTLVASTSDVYGKNPALPFSEESDLVIGPSSRPRWSYAVSKMYDEHICLASMEAYGFPVVLLRFFGSYGPRHHLSWWGGPQSVFIDKILEREEIPIHGDGKQTRSFTYISDTIEGLAQATYSDKANGEILNIGATREITIVDLAKLIHSLMPDAPELKLKFIPYEDISKGYEDVMRRIPDDSKIKRLLGVSANIPLEEGLKKTIEWQISVRKNMT